MTVLRGVKSVRATSYGTATFGYTPSERPSHAIDGDPTTKWLVDDGLPLQHEHFDIVLDHPITTDHVNLVQVLDAPNDRYITRALVRFDGGHEQSISRAGACGGGRSARPTKRWNGAANGMAETDAPSRGSISFGRKHPEVSRSPGCNGWTIFCQ